MVPNRAGRDRNVGIEYLLPEQSLQTRQQVRRGEFGDVWLENAVLQRVGCRFLQ
jgi:hypothetical protein